MRALVLAIRALIRLTPGIVLIGGADAFVRLERRRAEAQQPGIVAVPLRLKEREGGADTVAAGVEVVGEVGVEDLVVPEVGGPDRVHGAGQPLDQDEQSRRLVFPGHAGVGSRRRLLLAQRRGPQFGEQVGAVRLKAAGEVGVMHGPGIAIDECGQRLDRNAGESGLGPLFLHPVVPAFGKEATLGRGLQAAAERASAPSLVEG